MGAGGRARSTAPLQLGHHVHLGIGHLLLALLLVQGGQASSDTSGPVFIQVKNLGKYLTSNDLHHLRIIVYKTTIHHIFHNRNRQTMWTSATQQVMIQIPLFTRIVY